jgi:hypothetical protein
MHKKPIWIIYISHSFYILRQKYTHTRDIIYTQLTKGIIRVDGTLSTMLS